MKSRAVLFLIPFLLFFCQLSFADVTKEDISKAIDLGKLKHPYLYFNEADKAEILKRAKNDPEFSGLMSRLLAESNRLMFAPVDWNVPARSNNPRYDLKYDYENKIYEYSLNAYKLALAYQFTGDEKYADKSFAFADYVCAMPTWNHTAHDFPTIYDRVWPMGARDDQVVFNVTQSVDIIVFKIAAVYDWLYPALEKRERDRIRGALLEKVLLPVRGNYEYYWWAASYRCNWCAVLNSMMGVTAISLLTEDPQLMDMVAESYNRITKVYDEINGGGWAEGVSYMNYCITEGLELGTVLNKLTGGKYNLYKHPQMKNAIDTFIYSSFAPDRSVHVGDSGNGNFGSYRLYNRLMLGTGDGGASWLRNRMAGDRPSDYADLFEPKSDIKPETPKQPSVHFPSVEWVIMRSDFTDPEKVAVFAKSGMNDDPHHGHLDQGHISVYWRGQEILCDNGSAGYDKDYFDNARWDHPLANTGGHNCVLVNGEAQLCAKYKDEPWKEGIGGKVVEFRPGKDRDYALLDPTNAYPKKEMKGWRRNITLDKPEVIVVLDEVSSAKGAEIEARFHSPAEVLIPARLKTFSFGTSRNTLSPEIEGNFTILSDSKGKMAVIPVADDFIIREGSHAVLMAQESGQFRWVPYFGTVVKAKAEKTNIFTIILPVTDAKEADGIAKSVKKTSEGSGGVTLTFMKSGKNFTYKYKNTADGLVME